MWGLFPLYWALLSAAGAIETLAHRIVWSLVFLLVVLWQLALRKTGTGLASLRALLRNRRTLGLLALAAVLISINWGTYIWAVTHERVVEASLGYFIGPLASVLIGVLALRERLRVGQWTAVGLGAVAVAVLIVGYGEVPWVALILAFPFAIYGLVKKMADAPSVESLAVETAILLVPAAGYLVFLELSGSGTFFSHGAGHLLLLIGGGLVTTLPLLAFNGAATRIPLSMIGLLQYIAPVLQFACGVLLFREHMPLERWLGFALVWLALIVLTTDSLRHTWRRTDEPEPV